MRPWSPIETLDDSFPHKTLSQTDIPPCLQQCGVLLRKFKAGRHYPPPGRLVCRRYLHEAVFRSAEATDCALAQVRHMC